MIQFYDSISNGYWHSRRLAFTMTGTFHTLEWIRVAADLVFLLVGVLPIVFAAMRLIFSRETPKALHVETPSPLLLAP